LVGSGLVEPGVELLGELVLPLAAPLGCAAELELESVLLGEVALAPPEAEPGFAASLEPGAVGLDEVPLDGDVLELEEPGADEVLLVSPRSHAARPRASASAIARVESFMCPPWVGVRKKNAANCAPGLTP